MRNEDLDPQRCRAEFVEAMIEDLRWLGIEWSEGPDCGGPVGPYTQSERRAFYLEAWRTLRDLGSDLSVHLLAEGCGARRRERRMTGMMSRCIRGRAGRGQGCGRSASPSQGRAEAAVSTWDLPRGVNWRFRVPDGEEICFTDLHLRAAADGCGARFWGLHCVAAGRCARVPVGGCGR